MRRRLTTVTLFAALFGLAAHPAVAGVVNMAP